MRYYKIGLFSLLASAICLPCFTSAVHYKFTLENYPGGVIASNTVSHIHFKAGENDFGGLLVWNTVDSKEVAENLVVSGNTNESLDCSRQIKGLYFNSQRGERLWPLDEDTAGVLGYTGQGLSLSGGLFTSCVSGSLSSFVVSDAPYGIYGHINHTYKGVDYDLIAGVQYTGNTISATSEIFPSLQRFDNKFPLGLVYDYNGGLGFVGCEVQSGSLESIASLFSRNDLSKSFSIGPQGYPEYPSNSIRLECKNIGLSLDQLLLLKIQGLIGLSTDLGSDVSAILGNEGDAKMQYFSSVNLNNATLINYAKRRAEELCRGKWTTTRSGSNDIVCWQGNGTKTVNITEIKNKTVIVRGASLALEGKMDANSSGLNIFIDGGKLLINQVTGDMIDFNNQAYPSSNDVVARGIFLKGNFIVNGIVGPQQHHRVIIHGKFTSLNTYDANTAANRLTQVQDIVTSAGIKDIDLTQVFSWRCNYGSGTDGTVCPLSDYQSAPLVIINQNYPSLLLE